MTVSPGLGAPPSLGPGALSMRFTSAYWAHRVLFRPVDPQRLARAVPKASCRGLGRKVCRGLGERGRLPTKVISFCFELTMEQKNKSAQVRSTHRLMNSHTKHTVQQRPKGQPHPAGLPPLLCSSGVPPPRALLKAASFTAHA